MTLSREPVHTAGARSAVTARIALVALLALAASSCVHVREDGDTGALPAIRPAPAFAYADADGRTVSSAGLAGNIYIAYFFFTSCGGPCPVMNAGAATLQAEFADLADFRIVGFTVDPETDTPARLAEYAAAYGASRDRWHYLRAASDSVAALASKGFLMGDASTPALHSTRFALVDRKGMIRGYFDGLDAKRLDALRAAIRALEAEERA